jgi:hypothetical protein
MGIKVLKDTIENLEQYAADEKNLDQIPGLIAEIKSYCDKATLELKLEQHPV